MQRRGLDCSPEQIALESGAMDVKHVCAAMLGGIVSALLGGFLVAPVMLLLHADDGDVGWCLLWILLMALSGVLGAAFSARWWARKHVA